MSSSWPRPLGCRCRCGRDGNHRQFIFGVRGRSNQCGSNRSTVLEVLLPCCCPASFRPALLLSYPRSSAGAPSVRAMQTPANFCEAHGAASTPCPCRPTAPGSLRNPFAGPSRRTPGHRLLAPTPMASTVDSPSPGSSSDFAKRMERAWLIFQQPRPVSCSSCQSAGHVECKWCAGTGFFILGDNMLCEVPSRNSKCVICSGKGFTSCADCQGTGFRAKWLEEPHIDK